MDYKQLSKTLSYILRHDPISVGLCLDEHGWTDLEKLINVLKRQRSSFANLQVSDIEYVIKTSEKKRFEISGNKIRAYYGHSVEKEIEKVPSEPPEVLYHGTPSDVLGVILNEGLKPMSRQKVHLTTDCNLAVKTGKRKSKDVSVLKIQAKSAHADGIKFYIGNDDIWLCDYVPSKYMEVC